MKCIFCGRIFPDELLEVKCQSKSKDYRHKIRREACPYCASTDAVRRRATRMEIPNYAVEGAFQLAGAIVRGFLQKYRRLYIEALKEIVLTRSTLGAAVSDFLTCQRMACKPYFTHLSLGTMQNLTDSVRREEKSYISGDMAKAAEQINLMIKGGFYDTGNESTDRCAKADREEGN